MDTLERVIFGRGHAAERDRAKRLVRDAATRGQITILDRDRRLQELDSAQGLQAIEMQVHDLRHPPSGGGGVPPAPGAAPQGCPGQQTPCLPGSPRQSRPVQQSSASPGQPGPPGPTAPDTPWLRAVRSAYAKRVVGPDRPPQRPHLLGHVPSRQYPPLDRRVVKGCLLLIVVMIAVSVLGTVAALLWSLHVMDSFDSGSHPAPPSITRADT